MPTYDYQCRSCGTVTEVIHAMTADGPTVCERCGGDLRRVLYPAGIIFKGSGFYRTDSRAGSGSSDGGASTSTPDTSSTGSAGPAKTSAADGSGSSGTSASTASSGSGSGSGTGSSGGESAA